MAPSWVFAILFVLSGFLGIGQSTSIRYCGYDQQSQCVEPEFCGPREGVQLRTAQAQCPGSQICCRVEQINNLSAGEKDEYA